MMSKLTYLLPILFTALLQMCIAPSFAQDVSQFEGILEQVEDAGYPFFNITVTYQGAIRDPQRSFLVNVSELSNVGDNLPSWKGKFVKLEYVDVTEMSIEEIKYKGKSLINDSEVPSADDAITVTGILKDANAETVSDNPDNITVVTRSGEALVFPMYITKEMVAANGKEVTVRYVNYRTNVVNSLKLMADGSAKTMRGVLKTVEDGAYPISTISVLEAGKTQATTFSLNLEEVQNVASNLNNWIGKQVEVKYAEALDLRINEFKCGGKSLIPNSGPPMSGGSSITGILSGANAETTSDLPDVITVTKPDGNKLEFEYYITPEIVAANGKKVSIGYAKYTKLEVKGIKLAK